MSGATLSFISLLVEIYEPRARELEIVFAFAFHFFLFFALAWGKDTSPLADQSAFIIYNS